MGSFSAEGPGSLLVPKEKIKAGTNRKDEEQPESVCKGKNFSFIYFLNQVSDLK